jgi:hypothetical protein
MSIESVCLKCGSDRVSPCEVRLRPGTKVPLSAGLHLFLYLTSVPSVFLGLLLIARDVARSIGVALMVLAIAAFLAAVVLHRVWRKADVAVYHRCRACGYARTDDDPLPAIGPDGAVFLQSLSEGC